MTTTTPGHHAEHHGQHSLGEALRERLIHLPSMRPGLRLLVGAAVAQLVVVGILVALRGDSSLRSVPVENFGEENSLLPVAVLAVAVLLTAIAFALVVAGTTRAAPWAPPLALVVLVASLWRQRDVLDGAASWGGPICAAILAITVLVTALAWLEAHRRCRVGALWVVLVLLALVGGVYAAAYLAADGHETATRFSDAVGGQLDDLQYLLIPLLVLAGSEFGAWGDFAASRVAGALRGRLPLLLPALAVVVAAAVLVDAIRVMRDNDAVLTELLLGCIVVAAVALAVVVGRSAQRVAPQVAFGVVAAAAIADSTVSFLVENHIGAENPTIDEQILGWSAAFWVAAAVVVGLIVAAVGRRLAPALVVGALFVGLIAVTDALVNLDSVAVAVHPAGLDAENAPFMSYDALRALAAIVTIAGALAAVITRRVRAAATPVGLLLVLVVSLQVLEWLDDLFTSAIHHAEAAATVAAVVLILALVWELATSGEAVTNGSTRHLPRDTRVLVYLGYILLVAAAVLYFSSFRTAEGASQESQFDSEAFVQDGILFLGTPLVLTLCGLRLGAWWRGLRRGETAAPALLEHPPQPA